MLPDGRQLPLHGEGALLHLGPGDLALDQPGRGQTDGKCYDSESALHCRPVREVTGLGLEEINPLPQEAVLCPQPPQLDLVLLLLALHARVLLD